MKRGPGWRDVAAGVTACALVLSAAPAAAKKTENIAMEGGLGAGSALASLVWGPLKLVHAGVGLIAGGICFGVTGGDTEVWKRVMKKALSGDYVVTPQHLMGKKKLRFSGGGDDGGGDDKGGGDGK